MEIENIYYYSEVASIRYPGDVSSQIFSTNDLSVIENLMAGADENTLVLWDVDQTLLTPDDPLLKPKWEKRLDELTGGKKIVVDGKTRYIFREILMSASHSLVDHRSVDLVKSLQDRNIPVIAFSAAPGGKVGEVDCFVDWRIDELKRFGFDFNPAFPGIETLEMPKDLNLEFPPIYKSGVLVTSLHDKGPVLIDFFKELGWTPEKVIFIDDQRSNLESVVQALEGQIPTIGVHYTAADVPCQLDDKAAEIQVKHFLETGEWISQRSSSESFLDPVL